ncbi:endolytic transglycosylase MltG [Cellulomonas soli]
MQAGVVATQKAFTKAFAANPDAASIQPGTYNLLLEMKASDAVVALLDPASRATMKLTIAEGLTAKQIAAKITEITLIPTEEVAAALADPRSSGCPRRPAVRSRGGCSRRRTTSSRARPR